MTSPVVHNDMRDNLQKKTQLRRRPRSSKLHTARKISAIDWWLFGKAWILLLLTDVGLRLLSYQRVSEWIMSPVDESMISSGDIDKIIIQSKDAVKRASRNHIYKMTCLRRSLVLQRLIATQGVQTELRFGIQREEGDLKGHAWLEYRGRPVSEPETITESFAPLLSTKSNQILPDVEISEIDSTGHPGEIQNSSSERDCQAPHFEKGSQE